MPKEKALEKKALAEAEKEKKASAEREKAVAQEWAVGAKDNSKAKQAEEKEAEKLRKAAELGRPLVIIFD